MKPYAEFIGWQSAGWGVPAFPLFNIRGKHERAGSTVTDNTLKSMGIEVPFFPDFVPVTVMVPKNVNWTINVGGR